MDFTGIKFRGTFRTYQQRVLANADKFLSDKRINIVAAPGSGKTILGLELIRRLNSPCLILSPTTTIREQWGQRFLDLFLEDKTKVTEYISYDLNQIKLLNSITYQALYSAMNKVKSTSLDEEVDYSNLELFKVLNENNIKTICLDEAHHLQNEWQKALEKFIKSLDKNITIISLTATPPYDASPLEWNRYIDICGPIDDEIFVPELVKEKALCPHQDYIIFNYPSELETSHFKAQYSNSLAAIKEITALAFVAGLNNKIKKIVKNDDGFIYSNFADIVAIFIMLHFANYPIDKRLFYKLTNSRKVPQLNKKYAERSVNFLLKSDLINQNEKDSIKAILKKWLLLERGKAIFDLSEKQKRELVSSVGKLKSINKIVEAETNNLANDLRMLILTDYIKKENLYNIGKDLEFDSLSVVAIFETIRRKYPKAKLACLSGSLIILSKEIVPQLTKREEFVGKLKYNELLNTNFYVVEFKGQNKEKVRIVSQLFVEGKINILIGTSALLGEGWDSPCINSLILASYVGSFVLSNQMRGRAIRTNPNDPNKVANVWHLVTIEPIDLLAENKTLAFIRENVGDKEEIISYDYETLKRRFACFMGPDYDTGTIESGIDRISFIKPPYDSAGINKINEEMFIKASNRKAVKDSWDRAINQSTNTNLVIDIPKSCRVPVFTYTNMFSLLLGFILLSIVRNLANSVIRVVNNSNLNFITWFIAILISLAIVFVMGKIVYLIIRNISPKKSITALATSVLNTLKELRQINEEACLKVKTDELNINISISLGNANIYEQNTFNEAISELLSPIDNQRYIIIERKNFRYNYKHSFACPNIIGKNQNGIKILKKHLTSLGKISLLYIYGAKAKKIALKCRNKSFISKNHKYLYGKYKLTKFE